MRRKDDGCTTLPAPRALAGGEKMPLVDALTVWIKRKITEDIETWVWRIIKTIAVAVVIAVFTFLAKYYPEWSLAAVIGVTAGSILSLTFAAYPKINRKKETPQEAFLMSAKILSGMMRQAVHDIETDNDIIYNNTQTADLVSAREVRAAHVRWIEKLDHVAKKLELEAEQYKKTTTP